ncbi:MAG TPA: ABC transporter substrate-binding protein [Burkholderiales bacterium]|nr:ABC transporter substrate-binding protein [Burkholderiales bacterium]
MNIRRSSALSILLSVFVLAAPPARAENTVATLRLDWVPGSHHVGPILAAKRGYYAAEGIDMTVKPGKGSGSTVQIVASGGDTFGFADAGAMALAVSKGAPVIMVANTTPKGPAGIITLGKKIGSPQELEGKTIGTVVGGADYVATMAVFSKFKIPASSYKIISIEAASKTAALLTRKVDAIPGFRFGDYLRARVQSDQVQFTLYSDWGVNLLSNGYFVATSTLDQKPELVRAFLRATLRGWKDAVADPKSAVDALMEAYPESNRQFVEQGLPMVIEHMHSQATKDAPLGWMAEEDWKVTLAAMKAAGMEGNLPPQKFYRNLVER